MPHRFVPPLILASLLTAVAAPGAQEPTLAPIERLAEPLRLPASDALAFSLETAEALAESNSPTIARAEALIRAARCAMLQAGLPPNPTVAYLAGEIGADGGAGQQGIAFGQRFVRGGKLRLDRAVAGRETQRRRELLAAELLRVRTDVRTAYAKAYFAQQESELTGRLARVGADAARTAQEMLDALEGRRSDLLLAEIESQRARADAVAAGARFDGAWRALAAQCGSPDMAPARLVFGADTIGLGSDYETLARRLLATSPEIAAAAAAIERARCNVARNRAEPIPDLNAQASVQYDDAESQTIAGVQLGFRLPLWNRNQGGIGRARAELTAAQHTLEATERRLRLQLAERFQAYEAAHARAEAFRGGVLDRSEENLAIVASGYKAGEVGYLDVLTAQRTYFRVNLDYLTALREAAQNAQLIEGSLLADSLASGPSTAAP